MVLSLSHCSPIGITRVVSAPPIAASRTSWFRMALAVLGPGYSSGYCKVKSPSVTTAYPYKTDCTEGHNHCSGPTECTNQPDSNESKDYPKHPFPHAQVYKATGSHCALGKAPNKICLHSAAPRTQDVPSRETRKWGADQAVVGQQLESSSSVGDNCSRPGPFESIPGRRMPSRGCLLKPKAPNTAYSGDASYKTSACYRNWWVEARAGATFGPLKHEHGPLHSLWLWLQEAHHRRRQRPLGSLTWQQSWMRSNALGSARRELGGAVCHRWPTAEHPRIRPSITRHAPYPSGQAL